MKDNVYDEQFGLVIFEKSHDTGLIFMTVYLRAIVKEDGSGSSTLKLKLNKISQ